MNITVDYEITPQELGRAYAIGQKAQIWIMTATLAVAGLAVLLVGQHSTGIIALIAAALLLLAGPWLYRHQAARQLRPMSAPTTITLTDDTYKTRTEHHTITMKWSKFDKISPTPEFWLFYTEKILTSALPKAPFTPTQQTDIETFLTTHQTPHPT